MNHLLYWYTSERYKTKQEVWYLQNDNDENNKKNTITKTITRKLIKFMNLSVMRCFFRERKELLDERSKNALIKNENILEKLHIKMITGKKRLLSR